MIQSSSTDLAGRVAIVTGAGGGIGSAEARALAKAGAVVVVNDIARDEDGTPWAQRTVDAILAEGGDARTDTSDLSTPDGCAGVIDSAMSAFGRLDILVNNAGIYRVGHIEQMSYQEWDTVIRVNLNSVFGTIHEAVPIFKRQRSGAIVNTSSESGLGLAGQVAYSASKEAIAGMTRSLARELGHFGIRVNTIRPRAEGTTMGKYSVGALVEWNDLRAAQAPYAIGEPSAPSTGNRGPEEVAPLVVWLCSDASAHVNGRAFVAGGDLIARLSEPTLERAAYSPGGWSVAGIADSGGSAVASDLHNRFLLPGFVDPAT